MRIRRASASLPALALALALCAPASAAIYWANEGGDAIGRSSSDGMSVDQSFITGASDPRGVAIDGAHVYWAHGGAPGSVGRADLDGSNPNQAFIATGDTPQAVAVDSTRVYWSQTVAGAGRIGRARLDSSGPNQSFISTAAPPCGLAVGADDVYWANGGDPGSIGIAHIDGANPDQGIVTGLQSPCGVAVADGYLYWANEGAGSIGRSNLDGSAADSAFIIAPGACGVAVDGDHVFWTSPTTDTVGRADIDGTNQDASFITGAQDPCGIAVSPSVEMTPAGNDFGEIAVGGRSEILAFFAENTSSSVLDVTDVSLIGADPVDFEITGDGCTVNVSAPLGGCVVNLRFSPTAEGARSATLRISSNASNSPTDVLLSGEGVPDTEAPMFINAEIRPSTFAVDAVGPAERANLGAPQGTTFRYSLSEAARVAFTIQKRLEGRRVDGDCVRPAPGNRDRPPCTRLRRIGRFTHESIAGDNKRAFSGKIAGDSLDPGSYRAKLGARDAAGNHAEPVFRRFRIVP